MIGVYSKSSQNSMSNSSSARSESITGGVKQDVDDSTLKGLSL